MVVVLDASAVLKWLLEDPARGTDTDKASAIIESVIRGRLEILEPVHWLAEVAAVVARLTPQTAVSDVEMLAALQFSTSDDPNVIRRTTSLAIEIGHHHFDTLYHAVALEHENSLLVTADERYYLKGERYGTIAALSSWDDAA